MNIFRLADDPVAAAQALDDTHVNSHILENAQMLSTALRLNGYEPEYAYGMTHQHHPSTKWVAEARDNFAWMYDFTEAIWNEKRERYGGDHASWSNCVSLMPREPEKLPVGETLQPVVGGATDFYDDDRENVVEAYRLGYCQKERNYNNGRSSPDWYEVGRQSFEVLTQ